jgi:hypothetical protein
LKNPLSPTDHAPRKNGIDPQADLLDVGQLFVDLSQLVTEFLRVDEEFVLYRGEHSNQPDSPSVFPPSSGFDPASGRDAKEDGVRILVEG